MKIKMNSVSQQKRFLCTFSPIGLTDPFIRNICHKLISAKNKDDALTQFILNDDGLASSMSVNGRKLALEKFSYDRFCQGWKAVLDEVVQK